MKITKLILEGYNRFLLSNIKTFTYTPKSVIQIIASRNSSGKSSLLSQLNPLPPNDRDFKTDGFKHIEIEHNNDKYVLISSNNKHSFLKNNNELNPGHTKKVQLDLVQDIFNINPKVMDVVYMVNNFSDMGPEERKKWLTLMSNVDYSYSIKVYLTIKKKHRDLVGAIKLLQDEIVRDELSLKEEIDVNIFQERKQQLSNMIDGLNQLYNHNIKAYQDPSININSIYSTFLKIRNTINTRYTEQELEQFKSKAIAELQFKDKELNNLEISLNKINLAESLGNKKELEVLLDKNIEDNTNIFNTISYVIPDITEANLNSFYNYPRYTETLLQYIQVLQDEYNGLRFKPESYLVNTINKFKDIQLEHSYLQNEKNKYTGKLEQLQEQAKNHNIVTCPKCSNSWDINHNVDEINSTTEHLSKIIKKLVKITKDKELLEKEVEGIKAYYNLLNNYKSFFSSYSNLSFLSLYLFKDTTITTFDYNDVVTKLNKVTMLQDSISKYITNQEFIFKIKSNLELLKDVEENRTQTLQEEKREIETRIQTIIADKTLLKNSIERYTLEISSKQTLKSIIHTLSTFLRAKKDFFNYLYKDTLNKEILVTINKFKVELAALDLAINDHMLLSKRIENSKNKLEEYKKREKHLAILEDILSPSTGLIAKSINSFISKVVHDMNKFINLIWSYRLELQPCSISETSDLDYKFAVRIDEHILIDDIKRLSSSGKEIVDLAFRVVFTKYMKIDYLPLYLDELGASFDKEHHSRVYGVITNNLSTHYDQIYAISHYENIYGSMKNSDFVVLDNNNIGLSEDLLNNDVLNIERY